MHCIRTKLDSFGPWASGGGNFYPPPPSYGYAEQYSLIQSTCGIPGTSRSQVYLQAALPTRISELVGSLLIAQRRSGGDCTVKGMFTLRKCLQCAQISHPTDAVEPDTPADEVIEISLEGSLADGAEEYFQVFDNLPANIPPWDSPVQPAVFPPLDPPYIPTTAVLPDCPEKPQMGNQSLWATFARQCTHNEQLGTRPCGIICFW